MAVPIIKIKERIKAIYPKLNLSAVRLDALAAKLSQKPADGADDTQVDLTINTFNEILSFEDIAKQDDRERGLVVKLDKKKPEPPAGETEAEKLERETAEAKALEDAKEMPEWAKNLSKGLEDVKKGLASAQQTGETDKKLTSVMELLSKSEILKKLPEKVFNQQIKLIDMESDVSIENQITELEGNYSELVQHVKSDGAYPGPPPTHTISDDKPSEGDVKKITEGM